MRRRCLLLVLPAMIVLSACSKNTSGTKAADICVDADGDGYGTGSVCSCAGGCNDCNDNDRTVFQLVAIYTDADHDTFGIGAGSKTCIGAQAPNGFSIRAGDCNDASAACTSDCTDADGDGTPACAGDCDDANPHCTETCVDADSDGYCGVKDCNDHSALHWDDCTTCVDFDGDGRGPGCDRGTTDCNDSDTDNWVSCATCADADGDGYFAHCDAYVTRKGEDCDDTDAVCTNDCSDFDHDGVRACDGDCDDGSADAACTINANGGNANQIVDAGGAGGSILVTAGSVRLLGCNDALPAALFTHGSVPSDPAALIVTTTHLMSSSQTVAGLFVAKGATLTLSGAAPITLTVTDHVLIAGAVVSDSGGSLTIVRSGSAAIVDVTLAGSVDLHGATGASGHPGGTLIIGSAATPFSHAVLYGAFALRSGDAVSDPGAAPGSLTAYADEIYAAANIDVHAGTGVEAGGAIKLAAASTITLRENGIIASGGSSAAAPGQGGSFSFTASTSLTSTPTLQLTARGGSSTSAQPGGSGGQCAFLLDTSGAAIATLSSPAVIATGGDSSSGVSGDGGSVLLTTGGAAASSADAITIAGGIDVSGHAAGTISVTASDAASTIAIDHPLLAKGNGGSITIGTLAAAASVNAAISADATIAGQPGGVVDFHLQTLTYVAGEISANGTGGGYCLKGVTTAVAGDIVPHVHDSNGDQDGVNGDLDHE